MDEKIIIGIDAMGGDNAPVEIVKGAVASLADQRLKIILVGKEEEINRELTKHNYDPLRLEVLHASEVIENEEAPTVAIKRKKDSSLVKGLHLLKEKKASAFVSAGSTGALLTGATLIVGRIPGISRPALATVLPNANGFFLLIDSGANVDAKPEYLAQFAQMGSVYMENVMGIQKPRVGLINIGAEKEKGNALTKEAYDLLDKAGLNFVGNVEARDIPLGAVDVAVCDAFVGNVLLKYTEGFAKAMMSIIKEELTSGMVSKIGALLASGSFKNMKKRFDYKEVGGAPFLGLKALVVKAHGSSDQKAIQSAVKQCVAFVEKDIVTKIQEFC